MIVIPLTNLNKKDFWFSCQRRALRTREIRCQFIDGGLLSMVAIDSALISMGEDIADEAVFCYCGPYFDRIVEPHRFPSLCSFLRYYLRMKLLKGLAQNVCIQVCSFPIFDIVIFRYFFFLCPTVEDQTVSSGFVLFGKLYWISDL
jgi:hypothetical protein